MRQAVNLDNSATENFDYVAGLAQVMQDEGFTIPGKDLSNPDIAKAIYDVHMALKHPVENIVSRIGGLLFLKSDSVFCLENRVQSGEKVTPVLLSQEEKNQLRCLKEDIEVLTTARDTIERLRKPPASPEPVQDRQLVEGKCANCQGMFGDLASGRDPEELCDTCYTHSRQALSAAEPAIRAPDQAGVDLKQFENEGEAALRKRNFDFSGERRGAPQAPATTEPAIRGDEVEVMAMAYAKAFYGPHFDPFSNPEAYDMAEKATRAALAAIRSNKID